MQQPGYSVNKRGENDTHAVSVQPVRGVVASGATKIASPHGAANALVARARIPHAPDCGAEDARYV